MRFYLGTHEPSWLERTDVPLFLSRRRLARQKKRPRALGPWALDSGGFSELSLHGEWTITPEQYVSEVRSYRDEIGKLEWAASMDFMCEEKIRAMTGLTVSEHQLLTIEHYQKLRDLAPEIPWAPVLQGQTIRDYWEHVEHYVRRGVDLRSAPVVGIGSICRRQGTDEVRTLIATLRAEGVKLHGFGLKRSAFKSGGLVACLDSSDSMAWSFHYRKEPPLTGCTHASCSNCMRAALLWRSGVVAKLSGLKPWHWQESFATEPVGSLTAEERWFRRFLNLARVLFEEKLPTVKGDDCVQLGLFLNEKVREICFNPTSDLGLSPGWEEPTKS